jgi:hypothetical protein
MDECLLSLEQQAKDYGSEVIVVACGAFGLRESRCSWFIVLPMTPTALASEAVKKEWRYARRRGLCVFPVVVSEIKVKFEDLPH